MADEVAAHEAVQSHRYVVHFPPHPARKDDPHYVDFDHYHRLHRPTAVCYVGARIGWQDCRDAQGNQVAPKFPLQPDGSLSGTVAKAAAAVTLMDGLELHHAHVEFSLQQGVDLAALEVDFPGISDPTQVGAWVESDENFRWLCCFHHRGPGGAHTATHSDWEASQYVPSLITKAPPPKGAPS